MENTSPAERGAKKGTMRFLGILMALIMAVSCAVPTIAGPIGRNLAAVTATGIHASQHVASVVEGGRFIRHGLEVLPIAPIAMIPGPVGAWVGMPEPGWEVAQIGKVLTLPPMLIADTHATIWNGIDLALFGTAAVGTTGAILLGTPLVLGTGAVVLGTPVVLGATALGAGALGLGALGTGAVLLGAPLALGTGAVVLGTPVVLGATALGAGALGATVLGAGALGLGALATTAVVGTGTAIAGTAAAIAGIKLYHDLTAEDEDKPAETSNDTAETTESATDESKTEDTADFDLSPVVQPVLDTLQKVFGGTTEVEETPVSESAETAPEAVSETVNAYGQQKNGAPEKEVAACE